MKDLKEFHNKHDEALKICPDSYEQEILKKNKESFEKSMRNTLNNYLLKLKIFRSEEVIVHFEEKYNLLLENKLVFVNHKGHITTIISNSRLSALEWYLYLSRDSILTNMVSTEDTIKKNPQEYMKSISGRCYKKPIEQIIESTPTNIH